MHLFHTRYIESTKKIAPVTFLNLYTEFLNCTLFCIYSNVQKTKKYIPHLLFGYAQVACIAYVSMFKK